MMTLQGLFDRLVGIANYKTELRDKAHAYMHPGAEPAQPRKTRLLATVGADSGKPSIVILGCGRGKPPRRLPALSQISQKPGNMPSEAHHSSPTRGVLFIPLGYKDEGKQ